MVGAPDWVNNSQYKDWNYSGPTNGKPGVGAEGGHPTYNAWTEATGGNAQGWQDSVTAHYAKQGGGGGPEAPANPGTSAWGGYLSWQRKQLKKLLKQYRKDFPEYLRGWKEDSYADLDKATDQYGQASMVDTWKRGLGQSPAWQAGSRLDTAGFQEKGGRDIEGMAQQMQMDATQKMAAAVGRPDSGYANSASGWNQYQGQMDWQKQAEWQMNFQRAQMENAYRDPKSAAGMS